MFGLYAMDGVQPFQVVALHGMVRDQYGKKMSKSFGNVVDPLDWLDAYGADALRVTLARGATPARTSRSARSGCRAAATSAPSCGTPPVRPPQRRHTQARCRRRRSGRGRPLGAVRLAVVTAQVDAGYEDFQSRRPPRRCTTSSGTSSATGISSCPVPLQAMVRRGRSPAASRRGAGRRPAPAAPVAPFVHPRPSVDRADRWGVARSWRPVPGPRRPGRRLHCRG